MIYNLRLTYEGLGPELTDGVEIPLDMTITDDYRGSLDGDDEEEDAFMSEDELLEAYDELKNNKGRITVKKYLAWSQITGLLDEGLITQNDITNALKEADVTGIDMGYEQFADVTVGLQELGDDNAQNTRDTTDTDDDEEEEKFVDLKSALQIKISGKGSGAQSSGAKGSGAAQGSSGAKSSGAGDNKKLVKASAQSTNDNDNTNDEEEEEEEEEGGLYGDEESEEELEEALREAFDELKGRSLACITYVYYVYDISIIQFEMFYTHPCLSLLSIYMHIYHYPTYKLYLTHSGMFVLSMYTCTLILTLHYRLYYTHSIHYTSYTHLFCTHILDTYIILYTHIHYTSLIYYTSHIYTIPHIYIYTHIQARTARSPLKNSYNGMKYKKW